MPLVEFEMPKHELDSFKTRAKKLNVSEEDAMFQAIILWASDGNARVMKSHQVHHGKFKLINEI